MTFRLKVKWSLVLAPQRHVPQSVFSCTNGSKESLLTHIPTAPAKWIFEKKMETTIVYWGYIGIMEKKMETTRVSWGHIGIMEKKMETTIVYWGHIGIIEKKMETML